MQRLLIAARNLHRTVDKVVRVPDDADFLAVTQAQFDRAELILAIRNARAVGLRDVADRYQRVLEFETKRLNEATAFSRLLSQASDYGQQGRAESAPGQSEPAARGARQHRRPHPGPTDAWAIVPHAIYPPSAAWGVITSDESHALVGGSQQFIDELQAGLGRSQDEMIAAWLEMWAGHQDRNPEGDLRIGDWIPAQLAHVVGPERAEAALSASRCAAGNDRRISTNLNGRPIKIHVRHQS